LTPDYLVILTAVTLRIRDVKQTGPAAGIDWWRWILFVGYGLAALTIFELAFIPRSTESQNRRVLELIVLVVGCEMVRRLWKTGAPPHQ